MVTALIIVYSFFCFWTGNKNNVIVNLRGYIDKGTDVFSRHTLDSLLVEYENVMLTIGYNECSLCDVLRLKKIPENYSLGRYYIDATYDDKNMLVLQSLYYRGFPLSYIIDRNYNILGILKGLIHFEEHLDSVISKRSALIPDTIPGIPYGKTLSVLSNSFKGLLAYMDNDNEAMASYARTSLLEGSFIFNNYLMYKHYKSQGAIDSVQYFSKQILKDVRGSDEIIYETLLNEVEPGRLMTQYECNHNHH